MIDPHEVAARVGSVRRDIAGITDRRVLIVAVTKTFPVESWSAAAAAGCDAIGENYAQELIEKAKHGPAPLPVHFIGALQSNKVRSLAQVVSVWQGVERESVVDEIARRAPGATVMIQVNTTGEQSKSGVDPAAVGALVGYARGAGLSVSGLMTLGPTSGSDDDARRSFRMLRRLADDHGVVDCSMGMSGDYRIAVECGATVIRLGSVLFGSRTA